MVSSILGKKLGMTQVIDEGGRMVPVTVIEAGPCSVLQVKTDKTDGYDALQVGFAEKREKSTTKPEMGVFEKAGVSPKSFVREIPADAEEHTAGDEITVSVLEDAKFVDVVGTSKGKGFSGVMKVWNFKGRKATHGAKGYRVPGSIGQSASPARVHKGRKMAKRLGGARVVVKHLEVIKVDSEKSILLVKGAVPGYDGSFVIVRKSVEWVSARKQKKH